MRNALGLDSLTFTELQAVVGSQDSVRVRGTFGQVVIRTPTLTTDSLWRQPTTPACRGRA